MPPYAGDNVPVATAPPVTSSTYDNQVLVLFELALLHLVFHNFIVSHDAFMLISFLMYICQLLNHFCIDAKVTGSVSEVLLFGQFFRLLLWFRQSIYMGRWCYKKMVKFEQLPNKYSTKANAEP